MAGIDQSKTALARILTLGLVFAPFSIVLEASAETPATEPAAMIDGGVSEGAGPETYAAATVAVDCKPAAVQPEVAPSTDLLDAAFVNDLKSWLDVSVVRMTLAGQNRTNGDLAEDEVISLDKQWRAERKSDDQPLITAVLNSPLSSYLLRVQANSLGLYSEIFVMDSKGLNAGQSAITSDFWQGDEGKFQKTYDVGPSAVFIDEAEFHDGSNTWRAQVNLTVTDAAGQRIGAATVEVNLTELARRQSAGI